MIKSNFLYRVQGFVPPAKDETRMGMYGFGIELDLEFAKRAFGKELSDKVHERFQERGKEIVRRTFQKYNFIPEPYFFSGNENGAVSSLRGNRTFLASSFIVPGDACSLDLDWMESSHLKEEKPHQNFIEYSPHNVDSMQQAYTLFSLFAKWADIVEATIS
jgi:hypothetical protein